MSGHLFTRYTPGQPSAELPDHAHAVCEMVWPTKDTESRLSRNLRQIR
jgi:hypothetical protein